MFSKISGNKRNFVLIHSSFNLGNILFSEFFNVMYAFRNRGYLENGYSIFSLVVIFSYTTTTKNICISSQFMQMINPMKEKVWFCIDVRLLCLIYTKKDKVIVRNIILLKMTIPLLLQIEHSAFRSIVGRPHFL